MKKIIIGTMAALLGMTLGGCDTSSLVEDLVGDDEDQFSSSTLYLKNSSGTGVAGISYSCDGGYTSDGELTTSGNTSSTGDMLIDYWSGYDLQCTITPVDTPELYLFDINGPINDAQVSCASYDGSTGEDGAINNEPSDTCTITLVIN